VTNAHPIHQVRSFEIVGPYRLRVTFEDGIEREIDFEPVLSGELYGALRDRAVFDAVRIDPEAQTLVWPNGADFDPATLHDWPDVIDELTAMARRWAALERPKHDRR
jgi:hypothetical protein